MKNCQKCQSKLSYLKLYQLFIVSSVWGQVKGPQHTQVEFSRESTLYSRSIKNKVNI